MDMVNKETDKRLARMKLLKRHGAKNIKKIVFGKIRKDGTRNVKFLFRLPDGDWERGSYSYLTDIRG